MHSWLISLYRHKRMVVWGKILLKLNSASVRVFTCAGTRSHVSGSYIFLRIEMHVFCFCF